MSGRTRDGYPGLRNTRVPSSGLVPSGVVPGTYTLATVTVNAGGQVTSAANGAVAGGVVRDFVYWPSGVADEPNGVYTVWADLYAEIVSLPTPARIQFNSDAVVGNPVVVPAGLWDFTAAPNIEFVGNTQLANSLDPYTLIEFDAGAALIGFSALILRKVDLISAGGGGLITLGNAMTLYVLDSRLSSAGLGACVESGTTTGTIVLDEDGIIDGSGLSDTISVGPALSVQIRNVGGTVRNDTINGAGTVNIYQGAYLRYTGTVEGDVQTGVVGVLNYELQSYADIHGYQPAVAGDWPVVPATVQEALDELITLTSAAENYFDPNAAPAVANVNDLEGDNVVGLTDWDPGALMDPLAAADSRIVLTRPSNAGAFACSGWYAPIPADAQWTVWTKFEVPTPTGAGVQYFGIALFPTDVVLNPGTTDLLYFAYGVDGALPITGAYNYNRFVLSQFNSIGASVTDNALRSFKWMRLRYIVAGNLVVSDISEDGLSWYQFATAVSPAFTPAYYGVVVSNQGSTPGITSQFKTDFVRFSATADFNQTTYGRVV